MTAKSEQTPRITELHVRVDCNGCENKIRKALRAIDGVSEVYIDQASHKITVVGMADPWRMVKAIRKAKRVPTIFSHTDPAAAAEADQPPPPAAEAEEAEAKGEAQAPAPAPPPPADPPAAGDRAEETAPADTSAPEEHKEAKPAETPAAVDATVVVRTVRDHPYGYGAGGHGHRMCSEANHPVDSFYSHHRPTSPYVAEYGAGGGYAGFPVQEGRGKEDAINITCMFSDENPNACSIA
ncbi:Heavy metal-associated isoprenylated plant protein 26 [Zea mays]|uniref:HMA domain-containing protein n=2 Tax=Zea mays TaxID=4577 RepID=A0A1R3PF65_MAIZE|nr:heavy metal-associated isoprenylated plant protein 5 isoform X1 [Zea mays]ONM31704.1 hypothetical protein ZEAMMB73_Zm00001d040637 [Zea mays]PWZ33991.1 Heavy metal-associated isoprenylated plant protein 26 [Zea mays]|eukprot:XP_008673988.1 heavy metal-associated isoprenylated plant protein 5 isoform X1 [Zea mays]